MTMKTAGKLQFRFQF